MPGIEEKENTWRYRVRDPGLFEDFRSKETNGGVSFVFGKYKSREEWAIQSMVFHKDKFPKKEDVETWLSDHTVKEKASGPITDVKMSTSYDLILAYEEAIDTQCQVGLSKYIPEMEARGFTPDEGKKVLTKLMEPPPTQTMSGVPADQTVTTPAITTTEVVEVKDEAAVKKDIHVHLGDEPDPEVVALKKKFEENRVKITEALLKQLQGD
jgi:hypothetical protein